MTQEGKDILKTFTITSLEEIDKVAGDFIQYISESDLQSNIFAFYGKMGAGKTTFIKAICKALGVKDIVNSPTFTIINEYKSAKGFPIYHFDFYRIKKIEEVYDMGYEDYFYSGALCLIEWPELIEDLLPEDAVRVTINVLSDGKRELNIEA